MPEYFDVVDEYDRVTGKTTRDEAHKKGEWHRVVYVFVFNSRGEVFIQHRSDNKDPDPGLWTSSASGHVSSGQSYNEAAIRETEEELGVKVEVKPLFYMKHESLKHHIWVFEAHHDGPFRLQAKEVQGGKFVSLEELKNLLREKGSMFAPEFHKVFASFTG